ncbi:MAG: autotransporter outer membrane beta-barrel domain-containing protein [Hyphomicrobiaceae bacterium]|nr:autotransporter outer membrane beta-barrel domain-containing protein [Hyphomicrobiaceae bacterium]
MPGRFLFIVRNGIVAIGPNPDSQDASLPLPKVGVAAMVGHGWSALDATMAVARNYQCGRADDPRRGAAEPAFMQLPVCAFAMVTGSQFDNSESDDTELMGTAGIQWQPFAGLRLGAAVHIARPDLKDIVYTGEIDLWSRSVSAFVSYSQGRTGLQASALAVAGKSELDLRRTYVVGLTPETASAEADGASLGYLVNLGWGIALPAEGTTLTPYAEFGSMRGRINGYGELGVQYPAVYDDVEDSSHRSKLGAELRYDQPDFGAWLSAVWVHEFSPRDADVRGLVLVQQSPFAYSGIVRNEDWAEISIGARTAPVAGVTFVGSATAGLGTQAAPDVSVRIGANIQLQ